MHLMLRVRSVGGDQDTDLIATVEPAHTVAELHRALASWPGVGPGPALVREATGHVLDPEAVLTEIGLVSGETLRFASSSIDAAVPPTGEPRVAIEATGGPASGWRAEFAPGTYVIGRPFSRAEGDPAYRAIPDSAISRSHVQVEVHPDGTVIVRQNPEALNPLLIDGVAPPGDVVVVPGHELRLGDSTLEVSKVEARPPVSVDQLGQVAFYRTPLRPARPQEVELPRLNKVPGEPEPPRFSWPTVITPLIAGIGMAYYFQNPRFLLFTLISPIMAISNYFDQRKRNRQRQEKEVAAFEKRFAEREAAYAAAYAEEETVRHEAAPDLADLRRRVEMRDKSLWSRGRDIEEFLMLRVGKGPAAPKIEGDAPGDGDEEFLQRLEDQEKRYARFERVPVTVPLAELGVVGIHGPRAEVSSLGKALLLQAVSLHSPEDMVVAAAASQEVELIEWLKWVPHTHATGSPIGGPHLAGDQRSADALLRAILDVAEFRDATSEHGVDRRWPWVLVVLDRLLDPDPHLVAQVLDRCPDVGISVLWLSNSADRVPPQCQAVVELVDRTEGGEEQLSRVWYTDPEKPTETFAADGVDRSLPDSIARSLAPLRDASSNTSTSSIPRVVPLFAAHGIDDATPAWIAQQWAIDRQGDGGYALEAVVGMTAAGPLKLDLVTDGPHGLIGGTSGAGKSELIQSLVAGLVAYQSPKDLSLMFIDFKGGSASEMFKDLPHISGRVTDLDEAMAIRAQVSLRAELRRRVALFADYAAKDMADMRKFHPEAAPPSLVIVIDEFATLVKQMPDFVAEIIDIAQRGRSYGVHLILATQRPSSSVDDNILANTNLRISLRMLDRAESMSILNAPDAAEIPVPLKGRCIARMGPGQLVEFQSAYCSAPLLRSTGPPPVQLSPFGAGSEGNVAAVATSAAADDGESEIQQDAVLNAVMALNHPPVDQIWNELLPEHLAFAVADKMRRQPGYERDPGRLVLLGLADDPANQDQYAAVVDLEAGGGLLVLGTGGSGKTTVLRTMAASVALDDQRAGGDRAMVFALDFSSGELRILNDVPQCGGVGTLDDLEATTRIIQSLTDEINRRRAAAAGDEGTDDPRIVLLVDGYTNLADALQNTKSGQEQATDQWMEAFHRIVLDGRQVGIYTVITADRPAALRNSIFASMTTRLVMRQIDDAETKMLGVPSTKSFAPGGGFLDGLQVQVAILGSEEIAEDDALRAFVKIIDVEARDLIKPALPEFVTVPDAPKPLIPPTPGWGGVIGIADITREPVTFDMSSVDVLVSGPPTSGKSWALRAMAEQLEAAGRHVYAIGAEDSGLRQFTWKAAAWGVQDIEGLLGTMKAELEFPGRDAVLVMDDLDLLDNPAFDSAAMGLGQNRSIRLIGSSTSFGYSNNDLVKRVKSARQVLYLQPGSSREVAETIGVMRLPLLRLGLSFPKGRGMFVRNRIPVVVQVVAPEDMSAS